MPSVAGVEIRAVKLEAVCYDGSVRPITLWKAFTVQPEVVLPERKIIPRQQEALKFKPDPPPKPKPDKLLEEIRESFESEEDDGDEEEDSKPKIPLKKERPFPTSDRYSDGGIVRPVSNEMRDGLARVLSEPRDYHSFAGVMEPDDLMETVSAWMRWTYQKYLVGTAEQWFMSKNKNTEAIKDDCLCLYPKCQLGRRSRGLCPHHYNVAVWIVRRRLTTWEALEVRGKTSPRIERGDVEARQYFLEDAG